MNSHRDEIAAESVLQVMLGAYGMSTPSEIIDWLERPQKSTLYDLASPSQVAAALTDLRSPIGRFRFHIDMSAAPKGEPHPMVAALRAVESQLHLGSEVEHPLERDPRDAAQQYESVMTVRVVPSAGQALSSEAMPFHQDGLGSAGSIRFVAMCLDAGPSAGGRQLYANAFAQGIALAHSHWDRFVTATLPDALTVTRNAGKQHVSVTGPMFYVDECGLPAAHFRGEGGEYTITPSAAVRPWFEEHAQSIRESAEAEVLRPGDCLVVDNLSMVHARDSFEEAEAGARRLSRKWYAIQSNRNGVWTREPFRLHEAIYSLHN